MSKQHIPLGSIGYLGTGLFIQTLKGLEPIPKDAANNLGLIKNIPCRLARHDLNKEDGIYDVRKRNEC